MSTIDVERCALIYRRMKDKKEALEAEVKTIDADMDELKLALQVYMQENDLKSLKTADGATMSIRVTTRYSTADFVHFCEWARERPDAMPLFEKRLHQGNVIEWLKNNPEDVPPGLQSNSTSSLTIKAPKESV
jgi:hypothetical protein